jgi:diguanylate cyclase (GGDEF)-like protein
VNPDPTLARHRLSGAAYWTMMRRVVLLAGGINAVWLLMFVAMGVPHMAVISLVSVGVYAASYRLLQQRRNTAAVSLVWLEVFVHSVLGSLALGWDSGYHYYLMLFIPALVLGTPRRGAQVGTALVVALYIGLYSACQHWGPLMPLSPLKLGVTQWVNIGLAFAMFYGVADFYRRQVRSAEKRLLEMATIDPLTGLANRAQFHLKATAALNGVTQRGQSMALLLADIDFFKRINDEFGHDAGDKVLVRLAALMRQELREHDVLARWGGEEFLALLPLGDGQTAECVAEKVRQAVASVQIDVGGRLVSVTMSFGVSPVGSIDDLQRATQRADQALYVSKRSGRNRVTRAEPEPVPAI